MNPLAPISNIASAFASIFRFIFVVGLCYIINAFVSPGHWWTHWVAFGMGIAVLVAWARALKSVLGLALGAAIGVWLYKRYGADVRDKFDAWWTARSGATDAQSAYPRSSAEDAIITRFEQRASGRR